MKIGLVIQRFGHDIRGGAEFHGRLIAGHLAATHDIEILTTCARDYITWENVYDAGTSVEDGMKVRRFSVARGKDLPRYHELSYQVSFCDHRLSEEHAWLEEQGPICPDLLEHLRHRGSEYDIFIFFSYRYATVYHGLPLVAKHSILVPTAENDRIIGLEIFRDLFHLPGALAYNSIEERELIHRETGNADVPGVVVGVGLSETEPLPPSVVRKRHDLQRPFCVYVGRMEAVKGCARLADYFLRFLAATDHDCDLVFIGRGDYVPPKHPQIDHLTDIDEAEKMGLIEASRCLILPSPYESLSMVLLEAMAMKRPFLANGDCPVLRGQSIRSNGGLYYRHYEEFERCLDFLLRDEMRASRLGIQGHAYYREHYGWPTIIEKYESLFRTVKTQ